ncbi:MAG: hypothetical protein N4A33_11525 [Bacteriovoracaceae bacterium]|jgi:hypothetical protein|nr:hypothetical protein [Bacteriovoracaceae bacterium]
MKLLTKSFILLSISLFLCSCSISSLKRKQVADFKATAPSILNVKIEFESNLSESDEIHWREILVENMNKGLIERGVNEVVACESDQCKCSVQVKYFDDQETFSSWKVYVSGLSLGIIPMRFNAKYDVLIKSSEQEHRYSNEITSWSHILFVPIFFLTPSKEMKTREIGNELSQEILRICKG